MTEDYTVTTERGQFDDMDGNGVPSWLWWKGKQFSPDKPWEYLNFLRVKHDLSVANLAEVLAIHPKTYLRLERGDRDIQPYQAFVLRNFFRDVKEDTSLRIALLYTYPDNPLLLDKQLQLARAVEVKRGKLLDYELKKILAMKEIERINEDTALAKQVAKNKEDARWQRYEKKIQKLEKDVAEWKAKTNRCNVAKGQLKFKLRRLRGYADESKRINFRWRAKELYEQLMTKRLVMRKMFELMENAGIELDKELVNALNRVKRDYKPEWMREEQREKRRMEIETAD